MTLGGVSANVIDVGCCAIVSHDAGSETTKDDDLWGSARLDPPDDTKW